jgi:hypothetical protein
MPRQKDTDADEKLKAAQKAAQEVAISPDYVPTCQIDNAVVQAVWDKLAPPLIEAKIVNFATEDTFSSLCFHIVVCRKLQHSILNEDVEWFEKVQNYGDGGVALDGLKEAGPLKAFRQWDKARQALMADLSLRPRDMAGLWNLDKTDSDDEDLFT